MNIKGSVRDGSGYDSTRDNWEDTEWYFGFTPYNGTLNIHLEEKVGLNKLNYDFEIFNKFRVTKGVLKSGNREVDVWVGYQYNLGSLISLFLISDKKLRDELKLKTGDKVEVIL